MLPKPISPRLCLISLGIVHFFLLLAVSSSALSANTILKESEVPAYTLPDVLTLPNGRKIETSEEWARLARPAVLEQFETDIYGKTPRNPVIFSFNDSGDDTAEKRPPDAIIATVENESTAEIFGGKALLRQSKLSFRKGDKTASFEVLLVLPRRATAALPVPAIIGLNFWGNHTLHEMPGIRKAPEIPGMEAKERGSFSHRWPLESLIDRGCAVITAFRGEIVPESAAHCHEGILALFPENSGDSKMGAIGAWAWALSRLADYASSITEIDSRRLAVIGHSRLGKAALWAAAQDARFARVFANNTGCMGAALSRREFGETVAIITQNFPYWFAPRLAAYGDRVNELPVDQHQLLALIAPRPLHLGAAQQDLWADPHGELLALHQAARIYALYGIKSDLPAQLPPPDASPVGSVLQFHQREGKHDLLAIDWSAYLAE